MGVEPSGRVKVRQVLVVSPNEEWLLGTLQPMSPFLKSQDNCKKLLVSNVIITLCWRETPNAKSTGMELVCRRMALGEYGPLAGTQGIHLYHKVTSWARMLRNGGTGE